MNKIKLFLGVVLFGAMSFGAFSAYDYYTMSEEERALLENIEALTYGESSPNPSCYSSCYDRAYENCQVSFINHENDIIIVGCLNMKYL